MQSIQQSTCVSLKNKFFKLSLAPEVGKQQVGRSNGGNPPKKEKSCVSFSLSPFLCLPNNKKKRPLVCVCAAIRAFHLVMDKSMAGGFIPVCV